MEIAENNKNKMRNKYKNYGEGEFKNYYFFYF